MSQYRDEYYNRTPEQKHAIYKERARSLNVLRFGVAFFPFLAVIALIDHWFRTIVEPAARDLVAPANNQAVVRIDTSCLYVPVFIGALFLVALMVRAIGREDQEVRETDPRHSRRAAEHNDAQAQPVHEQKVAKKSKTADDSTLADDYIREMTERKARIRERASFLAMARKQKREAAERVREAQAERAIATAKYELNQSLEDRMSKKMGEIVDDARRMKWNS